MLSFNLFVFVINLSLRREKLSLKKWLDIWNEKEPQFDNIDMNNPEMVLVAMKGLDGWDHIGTG